MPIVITTPARRTVLRATAWTAPVVAVVAVAPAFAASVPATSPVLTTTTFTTPEGGSGPEIRLTLAAPLTAPAVLTVRSPAGATFAFNYPRTTSPAGWSRTQGGLVAVTFTSSSSTAPGTHAFQIPALGSPNYRRTTVVLTDSTGALLASTAF